MFWTILHAFLPHPNSLSWLGNLAKIYRYWFFETLLPQVIMWHRKELFTFDPDFAFEQNQKETIKRREEYLKKGGGPLDAEYPDMWDFYNPFLEKKEEKK